MLLLMMSRVDHIRTHKRHDTGIFAHTHARTHARTHAEQTLHNILCLQRGRMRERPTAQKPQVNNSTLARSGKQSVWSCQTYQRRHKQDQPTVLVSDKQQSVYLTDNWWHLWKLIHVYIGDKTISSSRPWTNSKLFCEKIQLLFLTCIYILLLGQRRHTPHNVLGVFNVPATMFTT